MTRAWLQKELRDHGVALVGWFFLAAIIFGLLLLQISFDQARGSWLESMQRFTIAWSLFGTTYLAGRLIRREYASKTQLFLESLPVSRTRVLTTKLLVGAVLSAVIVLLAQTIAAAIAWETQAPSAQLLLSIAARTVTVVWFSWALWSMAALLGRYRMPLLILLGLALYGVSQLTALEPFNAGPARLLGTDLAYSTANFPWRALASSWALIALFVGASYALLLARDGTLTVQLSDRMSHREKVYVTCVVLAVMVGIGTFEAAKKPEPYRLEDATVAEKNGARVEVSADLQGARARALADDLAAALGEAREYLGLPTIPGVALLPTDELDPSEVQRAFVANAAGIVLRAALWEDDLDRPRLTTVAIHDAVSEAHRDRAMAEPLHWMLDAYANLAGELNVRGQDARELLWLRAAYANPEPLVPFLRRWDVAQEQLGNCVAGASAATVLLAIEALAGPEAVKKFVRRILNGEAQRSFYAPAPDLAGVLKEETGLTVAQLESAWRARLEQTRTQRAEELGPLQAARPVVDVHPLSERTYELRHQLRVASPHKRETQPPKADPESRIPIPESGPVEHSLRYSLRYQELGPIDVPEDERDFEVQQALVNSEEPSSMPRPLVRGSRWIWVMELPSEALGCPVRVLSERREIR